MEREIVKIDRDLCNGCGECIPNCHEGALQIIDGKATLVSEISCDGLGACIGHCPLGAITVETREAEAYDEVVTVKKILKEGRNVLKAHMKHMKDHNELKYLKEAKDYLISHSDEITFDVDEFLKELNNEVHPKTNPVVDMFKELKAEGGGCMGSKPQQFDQVEKEVSSVSGDSQLTHWPVQMHLINPNSESYRNSDLLLAADCVAFSMGNFHDEHLKGKSLAIACPKLDSNLQVYANKLTALINDAKVNTITLMIMEVPCCGGLLRLIQQAQANANRKVPVKIITVSIKGEILSEEWN